MWREIFYKYAEALEMLSDMRAENEWRKGAKVTLEYIAVAE